MRNKFFGYEGDPENKSTVLVKERFLKCIAHHHISVHWDISCGSRQCSYWPCSCSPFS